MNLMRKLRGATSSVSADGTEASSSSSHIQLGLMHLKKLFAEYTHPSQPLSDAEKDDKLYNMLPLFCKVGEQCNISHYLAIIGTKENKKKVMVKIKQKS